MKTIIRLKSVWIFLFSFCFEFMVSRAISYSSDSMIRRYDNWLAQQGKNYTSTDEWEMRFGIYQSNVQFVDYMNSQNLPFRLTDNKFADLTNDEFSSIYLGYKSPGRSTERRNFTIEGSVPSCIDWRKKGAVTPIKDQGRCGMKISSFVYFSIIEILWCFRYWHYKTETAYIYKYRFPH